MGRSRTPAIGDIVEIATPNGLAYAQLTHVHADYGELLRVLPGLYDQRPADVEELARAEERFHVFYPLADAVAAGDLHIAGSASVPPEKQRFPTFRTGVKDPERGEFVWWLWDGEREERVDATTDELRHLSPRGVVTHRALVERIATGWSPRDWPSAGDHSGARTEGSDVSTRRARFYLYFPSPDRAERVAATLRAEGYDVETRLGADADDWLTLATRDVPPDRLDAVEDRLEELAAREGGEYDGNEVHVGPPDRA